MSPLLSSTTFSLYNPNLTLGGQAGLVRPKNQFGGNAGRHTKPRIWDPSWTKLILRALCALPPEWWEKWESRSERFTGNGRPKWDRRFEDSIQDPRRDKGMETLNEKEGMLVSRWYGRCSHSDLGNERPSAIRRDCGIGRVLGAVQDVEITSLITLFQNCTEYKKTTRPTTTKSHKLRLKVRDI